MRPGRVAALCVIGASWSARFAIGAVLLITTLLFAESLAVAYFKMTGQLKEGSPMYFELQTPTWANLLMFQAGCVLVVVAGLFLRAALLRSSAWARQKRAST